MPSRSTHQRVNWFTIGGRSRNKTTARRPAIEGGSWKGDALFRDGDFGEADAGDRPGVAAGRWPTDKSLAKELEVDPRACWCRTQRSVASPTLFAPGNLRNWTHAKPGWAFKPLADKSDFESGTSAIRLTLG